MKKVKNVSKKLIAVLLSAAMTFTPMMQSMPVYAAEVETQSETENLGTMPEADALDDAGAENDSEDNDAEEAAGDEQMPNDADSADTDAVDDDGVKNEDSAGDDAAADDASDAVKDDDAGKAEEKTEEKTEAKDDAQQDEVDSEPVYEEVLEEESESESESGSDEESESESEEMSLEENRASVTGVTAADIKAGGWNESIYAEIAKVKAKDISAITEVSWTGEATGKLSDEDRKYLVRPGEDGGARIDIPGLKAGTYRLSITVEGSGKLTYGQDITVSAYDRSGYAHFNYTRGVGAYNDDGTLKDKAVVLYVTDENKNDVTLTAGGVTVTGIGNILNSVGQDKGGGKTNNGGIANTNQGIIKKLADEGKPLVVRFIGSVSDSKLYKKAKFDASSTSEIHGLTVYDSTDYGGTEGDNGHMARIQSGKDITLEGIGYDAQIDGWGFHFISEGANPELGESFEVRNLTFINTPEDAVGMEGQQASKNANSLITSSVERCWVHHNEFYCPEIESAAESDKSEGDGSVDFKRGQYFTCSYNYFEGCHKTNLVGSADYSLQFNLSYHHNYWYLCKARGPLTRRANVHMYNNIFEMQTDYAMNTRVDAYIFSEYNMFFMCKSPHAVEGGAIKSYHDSISSALYNKGTKATVVTDKSATVANNCKYSAKNIDYSKFDTDPTQSYIPGNNYELTTDFTELRKLITAETGVMAKQPKAPKDVAESEYSVISKSGITPYSVKDTDFGVALSGVGDKSGKTKGYAFTVNVPFNITIKFGTGKTNGLLVNATGANLLEGSGEVVNLPAGTYMIGSADNLETGDSKSLTKATFKEVVVDSIVLEKFDPNQHYHNWVKNASLSKDPTCTEAGYDYYECKADGCLPDENTKKDPIPALGHDYTVFVSEAKPATCTEAGEGIYKCSRCDSTHEGSIPALGHSWGAWEVVTEATTDTEGKQKRTCTTCGEVEEKTIPKGGTAGGDDPEPGVGAVFKGDYVLTFEGGHANGTDASKNFFTLTGGTYADTADKRTPTVNGTKYKPYYQLKGSASIKFTCDDDMILFMACSTDQSNKKLKLNGNEAKTDSNAIYTKELAAGEYTITKDSELKICYLAIAYKDSVVSYTISFDFNYDDAPDERTITASEGATFGSMEVLAPSSFTRRNHILEGLYKDADCTQLVTYPYKVTGNATLYAKWIESDVEDAHSLIFNSNGGSSVATVSVPASQIYGITQKPTKDGYVFAGWYDALTGGNMVTSVDGSKMQGNMTVYAHWNEENAQAVAFELNCAKDLDAYGVEETDDKGNKVKNIKQKTPVNGFTIHAASGGGGDNQDSPKYYMTVADGKLGTNGVLLTDTSILGNEDGLLKAIEFTARNAGTLIVEVEASGNLETGNIKFVLAKQTSASPVQYNVIDDTNVFPNAKDPVKKTWTYTLDEAGTYYVYATGTKGVKYTSLKVTEPGYTIIYQTGTGTTSAALTSEIKAEGAQITLPAACTPAEGYTWKGWSVNGEAIDGDTYTVKADDAEDGVIAITAEYDAKSYTVKYDANGGTLPAGAKDTTAAAGTIINLENIGACTPPTSGTVFKGWKAGDRMIGKSSYTVNGADADENGVITLKAEYGKDDNEGGDNPSDKHDPGIFIEGLEDTYEYTGDKIIPVYDVVHYGTWGRKILAQGVDYTVTYKNNKDVSTESQKAQIIIKGKGNYAAVKGKENQANVTAEFSIVAVKNVSDASTLADLKGAKLKEKIAPQTYSGESILPEFTLTLKNGNELQFIPNTDSSSSSLYKKVGDAPENVNIAVSNNVNKGNATILVTGADGNNSKPTQVKIKFKIQAASLADVTVTPSSDAVYSSNGAVPSTLTFKDAAGKELALEQGRDYTVKYSKNKTACDSPTATVTVTGKGNYTKKTVGTYSIGKADITKQELGYTIAAVTACDKMKAGKLKATVVDKKGNALKQNKQYELHIYHVVNNEAGDEYQKTDEFATGETIRVVATATDETNLVTGDGKSIQADFSVGADISKAKFVVADEFKKGIPYTGSEIKLDQLTVDGQSKNYFASVTDKAGAELNMKKADGTGEYEIVSYSNNINKGTATAVIKGIGTYSGTKTIKFKIVQQTISKVTREKLAETVQDLGNRIADSMSVFN